ncbi:MAG: NADH-quinone oxidoreductase subunit M [Bacteroidetes bacterium]|nr:MAG: NADH-quinone oxidoreductase subunit M [Bacteroidota bacterium]
MITVALIGFPLLLTLALFLLRGERLLKWTALLGSLLEFGWAIFAWINYEHYCKCSLRVKIDWLESLGISLQLGMDGISILLVILTAFLIPLIILSSWNQSYTKPSAFYGLILLMEMAFMGVFTAFDGILFYIFWEMALIPAWFLCAVWGGYDRIRITFKFFIYTFVGSLFMLGALIYLYYKTPIPHSFDFRWLYAATLTSTEQLWIFIALFLAFAIKIPIFPFHTWQPDTYTTAPAQGTMLLSGIMLKMGIYGVIRWLIPITPDAVADYGPVVMILAITGIVYASLIAFRQDDMKRLVAYNSIAHVGLIAAGLFTLSKQAYDGAVIQMLSHGVNSVGLFALIGMIERRTGTRSIASLGGLARQAPWLAIFFMIILLGSISLPLTNGFVGEFLLLIGLFNYSIAFSAVAGLTIIFGAGYMLWMYQRVMLGESPPEGYPAAEAARLHGRTNRSPIPADLTLTEALVLIPIVIMIFWIGIAPGLFYP